MLKWICVGVYIYLKNCLDSALFWYNWHPVIIVLSFQKCIVWAQLSTTSISSPKFCFESSQEVISPSSSCNNKLRIRLSPLRWNTTQEELKEGLVLLMVSELPVYHNRKGRKAGRLFSEWLGSRVTTMPRALSFLPGTLSGPPACGDSANYILRGSFRLS